MVLKLPYCWSHDTEFSMAGAYSHADMLKQQRNARQEWMWADGCDVPQLVTNAAYEPDACASLAELLFALNHAQQLPNRVMTEHTANNTMRRVDKQPCSFFVRTGACAYGDRCKFKHPESKKAPQLNSRNYPLRPEEPDCTHYLKKGWCVFGVTCKFNHPEPPMPLVQYPMLAQNIQNTRNVLHQAPTLQYVPHMWKSRYTVRMDSGYPIPDGIENQLRH